MAGLRHAVIRVLCGCIVAEPLAGRHSGELLVDLRATGTGAATPVRPKEKSMPRKPNYRFERSERDRQKALKKAARLTAKQERTTDQNEDGDAPEQDSEQASEPSSD